MSLIDAISSMFEESGLQSLVHEVAHILALDIRQMIFVIAAPLFIGIAVWEYRKIRNDPRLMNLPEAVRNFVLGAGYQLTELLLAGLVTFPVYAYAFQHRLFDIELTWFAAVATFIGVEFCMYWMHRANHRVRWFWASHVMHHSSKWMNFSTAARQPVTFIFSGCWLFYVPLAFFGLNPIWIGVVFAISLTYQFFLHTTIVGKLHPAIEFLFNTPSHHRVHHGMDRSCVDSNYGGTLIIFDRIFGTFVEERGEIEYGVTRPPRSNNFLQICFHEYQDMFSDMAKKGSIVSRLKHLWMPPEWRRNLPEDAAEELSLR